MGLLLCFNFFGILTTKPPGRFWGAGFSLPLGEPRTFDAFLRQVVRGYFTAATTLTEESERNESDNSQWQNEQLRSVHAKT